MGIFTGSIKQVRDTKVGDTITHDKKPCAQALPGFKPSVPVVFCGLFPVDSAEFEDLRTGIEKNWRLNDASFTYENGILCRAWLRVPLRVSGAAASGSDPRPAGTRIRRGPDYDRALGGLSYPYARRDHAGIAQPRGTCPT